MKALLSMTVSIKIANSLSYHLKTSLSHSWFGNSVVHNTFLVPNGFDHNETILNGAFIDLLLASVGIDQPYLFKNMIEQKYFMPGQMGTLELMAPGAVDVRWKTIQREAASFFFFSFFQLMGVLYLKASAYEFAGHNSLYNDTYWYSLEQSSKKSLAHLLNSIGLTQLPLFGRSPGKLQFDHRQTNTGICSEAKWNDGLHGSDIDHCKAEIILINFPLCNNF